MDVPSFVDKLAGTSPSNAAFSALDGVGDSGAWDPAGAFPPDAVDQPVEVLERPPVKYPPALAQARIAGRVELEFVVDTLGGVEPATVRTLASTRSEFEAVARATILATRFRPAQWHGRPVRQLVRQALTFRAEGRR
jgi:TonB family protein